MKSALLKRAWTIAKKAIKTFGGKVREYLSEALKMAWSEAKELTVICYKKKEDNYTETFYQIIFGDLEQRENKKEEIYYQGYSITKGFRRFKELIETFKISYRELDTIHETINFMTGGTYISSMED